MYLFKKNTFFFLSVFSFIPISSLFLTNSQWNSIQLILQHKETSTTIKNKINTLLFHAYQKYAIGQAYTFKKFHKQKCFNIQTEDLVLASQMGLYKSILYYKGTTNFENYSLKYIQGELYKCLTDFHDITIIPKSIRRKKKTNWNWIERRKYNKMLKTSYVGYNEEWRFDKIQSKLAEKRNNNQESVFSEKTFELWTIINQYMDSCIFARKNKRIFLLKYDLEFNVKSSNLNISQQIGCSEETIRQILQKMKKELYPWLKEYFQQQERE